MKVRFDRDDKALMTVSGGGDDEIPEFFEVDWSLVDYPRTVSRFATGTMSTKSQLGAQAKGGDASSP